jgi:hypothetical protein
MSTAAQRTYGPKVYREQGGNILRVRENGNSDRGLIVCEDDLWGDCPILNWLLDPTIGTCLIENWHSYDAEATVGNYVLTQATAGTAAIDTAETGVLLLDSDSTTSTQGANLQRPKAAFVPVADTTIWAEFEFKIVDTFDKVELFCGLSEIDTSIIAASAMSTSNHIGGQCLTDDGVLLFDTEKATAAATQAAATIAEATYIKLGFKVTGVTSIKQYVNGTLTGSEVATANIPIVALFPSFVCQSAGTNDPIMHLRGYRIFQTRA